MSYAIQCCIRCRALEHGHTGPGDKYICVVCWKAGYHVNEFGHVSRAASDGAAPALGERVNLFVTLHADPDADLLGLQGDCRL